MDLMSLLIVDTRYSEILDFHNIDQGTEAGQALVSGAVQGNPPQAYA